MITKLSEKIVRIYFERDILNCEKDKEIYQYGFALLISTCISFSIVMTISVLNGASLWSYPKSAYLDNDSISDSTPYYFI